MAIARKTTQDASATGTSTVTATYPAATTAGNLLIMIVTTNNTGASVPAGWSIALGDPGLSATVVALYYKVAAGSETTVTSTDTGGNMGLFIAEYNGFTGTPTLDVSANNGSGASVLTISTGTTVTTTTANGLAIAAAYINSATTFSSWSNAFVNLTKVNITYSAEKILSATGTQTSLLTTTGTAGTAGALIATFKDVITGRIAKTNINGGVNTRPHAFSPGLAR